MRGCAVRESGDPSLIESGRQAKATIGCCMQAESRFQVGQP
jgi:hypothetical protein